MGVVVGGVLVLFFGLELTGSLGEPRVAAVAAHVALSVNEEDVVAVVAAHRTGHAQGGLGVCEWGGLTGS